MAIDAATAVRLGLDIFQQTVQGQLVCATTKRGTLRLASTPAITEADGAEGDPRRCSRPPSRFVKICKVRAWPMAEGSQEPQFSVTKKGKNFFYGTVVQHYLNERFVVNWP